MGFGVPGFKKCPTCFLELRPDGKWPGTWPEHFQIVTREGCEVLERCPKSEQRVGR